MHLATLVIMLLVTTAFGTIASSGPAAANQVSSLSAQAKKISQELVQEQLQAGAYQQQYSVASAQVAADERAIAAVQSRIQIDRLQIAKKLHTVRQVAIESYVLNGSVSSTSGAALFAEDANTAQIANEYVDITVGNLSEDLDQLHTSQRLVQSQQQTLISQRDRDLAEQAQEASYLTQANDSTNQIEATQAQVTGQLAVAVAQQDAAQQRAAVTAVATAQRTTIQKTGGATSASSPSVPSGSSNLTDPALNPFLSCVVQAESGGNYQAVSPDGLYRGAFQFSQGTWNYAAQAAGLSNLVGVPPNQASKAEQDTVAVALYALDGERPWLGDRCSS